MTTRLSKGKVSERYFPLHEKMKLFIHEQTFKFIVKIILE